MYKKSQAALEFLTTYGWAFLVIGIVIAAIAYFGVLKPSKILPERCTFGAGFGCEAYEISSTGAFELRLKNNVGDIITVSSISLSTESTTPFTCATPPTLPSNWKQGDIRDLVWSGCNADAVGFISGEKGKILLSITYYGVKAGSTFTKIAEGEVFSTIT